MKKAIYGTEDHPSVAEALDVKGKIYDHLGEFDKEQAVWERILEIQHSSIRSNTRRWPPHTTTMRVSFCAGVSMTRPQSISNRRSRLRSKNFGKTHADYFGRLVRLATCRYEQQEYSQAQKILDEAKRSADRLFLVTPPSLHCPDASAAE